MLIFDTNYNCIQRTTKPLQKRPNRSKIKKILKASLRRNERNWQYFTYRGSIQGMNKTGIYRYTRQVKQGQSVTLIITLELRDSKFKVGKKIIISN